MANLLHVMASPRGSQSISSALGATFVRQWREANGGGEVVERDLTKPAVPYMDVDWIYGVYAPPTVERSPAMQQAIAFSAELIEEVRQADAILVTTPMYNFTIPAVLKSWIDYIVRPGFTFALGPGWPALLSDRPVRVLIACRNDYEAGSRDDQVTPVLRRAFEFIGLHDFVSLLAGGSFGVNRGEVRFEDHVARFDEPISTLAQLTA